MSGKRTDRVRWRGSVEHHADVAALLEKPGDIVLVHRGFPRWLVFMCPCGCGESISISVASSISPRWRFYRRRGRITLHPSVWRASGCESHFIVWNDEIHWIDDVQSEREQSPELQGRIEATLDRSLISYVELADRLGETPWDVLYCCRSLVRKGFAAEGSGPLRGHFSARQAKP